MVVDKNQAVINYLLQCPQIQSASLYFNFGEETDNSKQIITQGNDRALNKSYIDGSVLKRYTFVIVDFRSISDVVLARLGYPSENVEEILDVQAIIDWISEQDRLKNYPDFGSECEVESIEAVTENPNLTSIDTSVSPAIACYSISVRIQYIDNTNKIWS